MGLCASVPLPDEQKSKPSYRSTDKEIQNKLEQAKSDKDKIIKILLLGTGESGKSTIFKQLRIIYGEPPSADDYKVYAEVVKSNIAILMKKMCQLIKLLDEENNLNETERIAYEQLCSHFLNLVKRGKEWTDNPMALAQKLAGHEAMLAVKLKEDIKTLYRSVVLGKIWPKRSLVNAVDGHKMFLKDIDIISKPDYLPTNEHILHARVRTTRAVKQKYVIDKRTFEIFDVGGQKSERNKWYSLFDDVNSVIFVSALSEYDQMLTESSKQNRMVDAIDIYKSICNNPYFVTAPIMLFLNKKDIFADKIQHSSISDVKDFSDYEGGSNYDQGIEYFVRKFRDCFIDPIEAEKRFFVHITCATDTDHMTNVLNLCRHIILEHELRIMNLIP